MPEYDKEAAAERMKVRTKELTDKLESGMKELYNSDKYKDYLKSMSHFHNYSSKNIMLIHQQMPQATRVASFTLWKEKFDRQVKKGETGLYIYAPIKSKEPEKKMFEKLDPETGAPLLDENGKVIMEELTALTDGIRFKLVPVFDIQQTHGEPLPELVENITGNVTHYNAFLDTLKAVSPLPIEFEPMNDKQDGYCRFGEKIGIRDDMSQTQTICAVVHEMTHARLHDKQNLPENAEPKTKRIKEIESESIAYVVCQHYGIETSPNSFGYLAEYGSRDMSEIKASLDIIRKEANSLITAIDDRLAIICKERGIDLTAKESEQAAESPVQAEPSYSTVSRTENIAGVDFEFQDVVPEAAKKRMTVEEKNYEKFAEMFPQVASGEYSYLRLEAGGGFEPLSFEWIDDNKLSVMHTYTQNGDLCYDPMMVFEVNKETKTFNAVEYEQSIPPLYQIVDEDGRGRSIDGNGREQTLQNLQMNLNGFASQWLENIGAQEYMPVRVTALIDGEDTRITFDSDGKPILPEQNTTETTVPERESDDIMPDPAIGLSEMNLYGYTAADMLPLTTERAIELFNQDLTVYILFDDNTEMMVYETDDIHAYGSTKIFGIDREEWQNSQECMSLSTQKGEPVKESTISVLAQDIDNFLHDYDQESYLSSGMTFDQSLAMVEGAIKDGGEYATNLRTYLQEAADERYGEKAVELLERLNEISPLENTDSFSFYQLKDVEETRYHRFASLKQLEADNLSVDRSNYELAYTAPLPRKETLEGLYEKFNLDPPKDYIGRSMSVSDVIVIERGGETSSHYVDNFGFAELPAFLGVEKQQDNVPQAENDTPATNTTNIDFKSGIIGREELEMPEIPKKEAPIYKFPVEYALQNDEITAFHQSRELNVECGRAIDKAITDSNYEQYRYDLKGAAKTVIEEFGVDRAAWVLASNINYHDWDGRLSNTNKAWAKEFDTPKPDVYLQTHLAVLDGFAGRFREAVREKPSLLDTLTKNEQKSKQQFSQTPTITKETPKIKKDGEAL